MTLPKDLKAWIDENPIRADLIIESKLLSAATLRQTLRGSYIPSAKSAYALRQFMELNSSSTSPVTA